MIIQLGFEIAIAGVVLFATGTLFIFILLLAEYDTSKCLLTSLLGKNIVSRKELVRV